MFDVAVIGAGLGGLIAAAKLAKEGKRVVVLEKHSRPGGCATTFRRRNYEVEVSLHLLDGLDDIDSKTRILRELDVFDHLEWVRVPELYSFVQGNRQLTLPVGLEAVIEMLSREYPQDRKQIGRILRRMSALREEIGRFPFSRKEMMPKLPLFPLHFPNYVFGMRGTIGHYLDKRLKSDELKLVMSANLSFFHDDPYATSAKYFGVAQGAYMSAGACYIKGGSQRLSDRLKTVIENKGGEVRLNHLVTKINTRGQRATGIEFSDGTRTDHLEAKHILANAAVPHIIQDLLEPGADRGLERRVNGMSVAASLLVLHVGFSKPLKELGNTSYTNFVYPGCLRSPRDLSANYRGPYEKRVYGFTDYGQIESGLAPEGKTLGTVCTLDYYDNWDRLSKQDYLDKKKRVAETFLERIETLIPGSGRHVEFWNLGTPKTVERYTNNTGGSFGGYSQTPNQTLLRRFYRVRSSLKNLHFAGAWQFPGGGYTCAMLSGYLQAINILESGKI